MIYECPNCRMPQEAGQTICPHCFAEFDGPVPSDAVVPALPEAANEAAPSAESAAEIEPEASEPVSSAKIEATQPSAETPPEAPPLTEVPPPAFPPQAVPPASSSQPYLTAPSLSPLPYSPPDSDTEPMNPAFSKLSRALLIAFPIVLVLVLGSVFYANSLNAGSDAVPVTPAPPPVQASAPLPPVPAPSDSPTVLQGAGNTNDGANDPRAKMLAGRWVAGSGDFYVFSSDGTGSRGNPAKQQKEQTFLWGLAQNRVMLYMDKNELLRFSAGPDDNTIFLGPQTGRYVQYSRSKT